MKSRFAITAFFVFSILLNSNPVRADGYSFECPELGLTVLDLAVSDDGQHLAMALAHDGAAELLVDGEPKNSAEVFGALSFGPDGRLDYWFRDGGSEYVVVGDTKAGPFDAVYMPDLAVVADLADVDGREWAYGGGWKTAFAASNSRGDWYALTRNPAHPEAQDRGRLTTSRSMAATPDPWYSVSTPLRYLRNHVGLPVFLARDGDEECFFEGAREVLCGDRIALLSLSHKSGKMVAAALKRDQLTVETPFGRVEDLARIDWVAFSPSGNRLAFVTQAGRSDAVWLDGKIVAEHPRVRSLGWTAGERLVWLAEDRTGTVFVAEGRDPLAVDEALGFYVSPTGDPLLLARKGLEWTVGPYPLPSGTDDIWSDGFLATGQWFGTVRAPGEGTYFQLGSRRTPCFREISTLGTTPDGKHVAVMAANEGNSILYVDGQESARTSGRADHVVWMDSSAVLVVPGAGNEKSQDCAAIGQSTACCHRLLGIMSWNGAAAMLCSSPDQTSVQSFEQKVLWAGQATQPHLVSRKEGGAVDAFAALDAQTWSIVTGGMLYSLEGTPHVVLAGRNGPWYMARKGNSFSWWHDFNQDPWFDWVRAPFTVTGQEVYLASDKEGQGWVVDGRRDQVHTRVLSSPVPEGDGYRYWVVEDSRLRPKHGRLTGQKKE